MASRLPARLPDLLVGLACVFLIVGLLWFALSRNRHVSRSSATIPAQMRSIHQAALAYGVDNGGRLPGLHPDGSLYDNAPAARYRMMTHAGYLTARELISPLEAESTTDYSFAILDLSEPGLRREAWTVDARPDAPVLSERPETTPLLGTWSGWVMWHQATLGPLSTPVRYAESPSVTTNYAPSGPRLENDHLFRAQGPDDAYLIAVETE